MAAQTKQRLWLICELYYPEVNATGHYITQIGSGLADQFDVRVICAQPNYLSKGIRAPKRDTHEDVSIRRVWSTTLNKDLLLFRLINMLTIGASMFVRSLISFQSGDIVLVVTAPPSLPYTTVLAARMKRSTYTVLLHDLYPDILVAVGKTKRGSLLSRIVDKANRWLYRGANRLIVVGRDMNNRVLEKLAGHDVPIEIIPNWADLDAIEPTPRASNQLLIELGICDKFVLMYAGNIGHPTDVETIIDAAELLHDDPSVHFVFVGSGAKKAWIDREVKERGLSNVSLLGQRPREEQNVFLNACDIGLVALVPGMIGTAMPSRTYNILAAGKPIIALTEPGSELSKVIDEERVGWHIIPRDPEALVRTIKKARADTSQLNEMGSRARAVAVEKYSPAIAVGKYADALRS
jgi:glycosyltransferase involved in cell wall biosynthesis